MYLLMGRGDSPVLRVENKVGVILVKCELAQRPKLEGFQKFQFPTPVPNPQKAPHDTHHPTLPDIHTKETPKNTPSDPCYGALIMPSHRNALLPFLSFIIRIRCLSSTSSSSSLSVPSSHSSKYEPPPHPSPCGGNVLSRLCTLGVGVDILTPPP